MDESWGLWADLVRAGSLGSLERGFVQAWDISPPGEFSLCSQKTARPHSEAEALLLCYLLKTTLAGNLCARWDEGLWSPDPALWLTPQASDLRPRLAQIQREWLALVKGEQTSDLIAADLAGALARGCPLIADEGGLYLQRGYGLELALADALIALAPSKTSPSKSFDEGQAAIQALLKRWVNDGQLLSEQAQAIQIATGPARLTCIAGGPGTGKTYTAGRLLASLILTQSDDRGLSLALAAPTGRAAAQLRRALENVVGNKVAFSGTLHKLLGIYKDIDGAKHRRENPLIHDLILIDEASMIDAQMLRALLAAIQPEARLILMGDPDQLPSIEMGGSFVDTLKFLERRYPEQVMRLTRCLRTEIAPIVELAASIRSGDAQGALKQLSNGSEVTWIPLETDDDQRKARREILGIMARHHPPLEAAEALSHFERLKLLTPLTVGPWGTEQLNGELLQSWQTGNEEGYLPIMLRINRQSFELYNGDQGVVRGSPVLDLAAKHPWRDGEQIAQFSIGGELRNIPLNLLPDAQLAWAMSIHKAQGSEFERVLLIIPPGTEHLSRSLLYTAVTRARRQLTIWSSREALIKSIERGSERRSGLVERLMKDKPA